MPPLEFEKAVVTSTRPAMDNPFLDAVKGLPVGTDEGLKITVEHPDASPEAKKAFDRFNRQLNDAGKEAGVTVKRGLVKDGDVWKLQFKATPRIKRKAKSEVTTDPEAVTETKPEAPAKPAAPTSKRK